MKNEIYTIDLKELEEKAEIPVLFISGGHWFEDQTYLVERRNCSRYLLLYTISGEGKLDYEGREYSLLPGTVFLIDCMRFQRYRTAKDEWEFCWMHFTADPIREYVDGLYRRYGAVFRVPDSEGVERRIWTVLQLFQGHDPAALHKAFGTISELLGILYASVMNVGNTSRFSQDTEAVIRLIEKKYDQKITLDGIAREIGRSKYYLAHQFKEDMGIAVYSYLTLFRMGRSKVLLQNTSMPVAAIAELVGFASVSNYIRTFSSYERVTPQQYRKKWQG